MTNYESLSRLKELFRELFQLDTADLDFGLYRLFRLKRSEIEAFLDKQIPADVEEAFASLAGADRGVIPSLGETGLSESRIRIACKVSYRPPFFYPFSSAS